MQNIAIIKQGTGRFLFSVPENVTLREGDRVKCDTRRGITDGIAFADSAWVDENVSQLIGKLTGAKFPLKSVVGRLEYLPFEKPQDKPASNPTNKYESMSNTQLDREMCAKKGACSATYGSHRKNDCPLHGTGSCNITNSNRAEVIKYLLAEDAEEAPKPEDKPSKDKQEPIKLYCVKDCPGPCGVSKGKIYDFDGGIEYDNANHQREYDSYEQWKRCNKPYSDVLFPLVKRPAKVGEWVCMLRDDCMRANKKGDIAKYIGNGFLCDPTGKYPAGISASPYSSYYLVLDGYKPEPEAEPEPEYFSGKVVCVSSGDECFTVGKMYEFVNGEIKDDDGDERPVFTDERFKSVEEWNEAYGMPIACFIEYKGEAHD